MRRELVYMLDILQSAEWIQTFTEGMSQEAFEEDVKTQDAVIRRIEIIGEAVRRLSVEFCAQYPHIPWRQIRGMRNKLIHRKIRAEAPAFRRREEARPPVVAISEPPGYPSYYETDRPGAPLPDERPARRAQADA